MTVALDLAAACWPLQGFVPRPLAVDEQRATQMVLADRAGHAGPGGVRLGGGDRHRDGLEQVIQPRTARSPPAANTRSAPRRTRGTVPWCPATTRPVPARLAGAGPQAHVNSLAALRLFAVDYAVLPVRDPRAPTAKHTGLQPLDPLPGARLYRVTDSLPRVFWLRTPRLCPTRSCCPVCTSRPWSRARACGWRPMPTRVRCWRHRDGPGRAGWTHSAISAWRRTVCSAPRWRCSTNSMTEEERDGGRPAGARAAREPEHAGNCCRAG